MKRVLSILSGLAVVLTTVAYAHMVQYMAHLHRDAIHNTSFQISVAVAIIVGALSLAGAVLLLMNARN